MKNFVFFILVCLVVPLLGRCGIVTTERQAYAVCMAVDLTEEGLFRLSLQCPNVQNPSGSSSSGEEDVAEGYIIVAATDESLTTAVYRLEATLPAPINFSQLRLCMFSSDVMAKYDLRPLLLELFRLPYMRSSALITVTQGKAYELLHAQRVTLGVRLSTHLDAIFKTLITNNYVPQSTLETCLTTIGSGRSDALLCLGAINPLLREKVAGEKDEKTQNDPQNSGGGGENSESAFADSFPSVLADDIPGMSLTEGPNPVEFAGAAITSNGFVVGYLSPREMVIYSHLMVNGKRRAAIDGDQLQLQILLNPEDFNTGMYFEMMALFEKFQALHADAFGFGNVVARSFLTKGELEAYGFAARYPSAGLYIGLE